MIEIDCYIKRKTKYAWLVNTKVGGNCWIPKSLTEIVKNGGTLGQCDLLKIPKWLAEDKGII